MRRDVLTGLLVGLCLVHQACGAADEVGWRTPEAQQGPLAASAVQLAADTTAALGCDLLRLRGREPGNVILSPYSLTTALAMTYAGARGTTREQMAGVLHVAPGDGALHDGLHQLRNDL